MLENRIVKLEFGFGFVGITLLFDTLETVRLLFSILQVEGENIKDTPFRADYLPIFTKEDVERAAKLIYDLRQS